MSKKVKRRRRPSKVAKPTATLTEEAPDSGALGGYVIVAILFGVIGGVGGAIDGYKEGGLAVALICMPISAAFIALIGVVAVSLRSLISLFFMPVAIVLIMGVVAYDLIWGLPDEDTVSDPAIERVEDAVGALAPQAIPPGKGTAGCPRELCSGDVPTTNVVANLDSFDASANRVLTDVRFVVKPRQRDAFDKSSGTC